MIDFPNTPTLGQQFTAAGVTWTWDGTKWTSAGLGTSYLPLAGGALTGPLTAPQVNANVLAASDGASVPSAITDPPPGDNDHSLATTAWANANVKWGDNKIINGDMRLDQRNNGAGITATGTWPVDRWTYINSTAASRGTAQRIAAPSVIGFGYCLSFTSSSAYVSAAADYIIFQQRFEGDTIADFAWGTPNAQPATLSFLVLSTVAGNFSGAITNPVNARSYPFTFSVSASAWTRVVIPIPADTGGTWTLSGNTFAASVAFDLGCGANTRAPANAWVNGSIFGATGAASIVATNGAQIFFTGVKLEVGSVATPFNHPSLAQALAACQRYYQTTSKLLLSGYQSAGGIVYFAYVYPTVMRAAPTCTLIAGGSSVNCSAPSFMQTANDATGVQFTITATGVGTVNYGTMFNAEL